MSRKKSIGSSGVVSNGSNLDIFMQSQADDDKLTCYLLCRLIRSLTICDIEDGIVKIISAYFKSIFTSSGSDCIETVTRP